MSVTVEGHHVRVASLEDIIVSKETIDWPDRAALPELRNLRTQQPPRPDPTAAPWL